MSDISALIKCGIGGLAVVVGTLIVLSPIITPVAMAVGVVAAPVFGAKALCHKATLHSLKNKKNFRECLQIHFFTKIARKFVFSIPK